MSRGTLALIGVSSLFGIVACGEAFTVAPSEGAGAASALPSAGSGAKSLGGWPGVLTRNEGGESASGAGEADGGAPHELEVAGAPGSAGAPEPARGARCPQLSGEKLVLAGDGCIDESEVTAASYQAFVDAKPSLEAQPSECLGNVSFVSGCKYTDPAKQPVRCVDWCDAHAYCASVGKRLCGARAGGGAAYDAPADSLDDQWYAACSHGGEHAYPYGDDYDPSACWGSERPAAGALTVKSSSKCEGGFDGLFDMSGGMAEWVDSCSAAKGMTDACRIRGGSSSASADQLRCDRHDATVRSTTSNYIGFRCCADALY